MVSHYSLRHAVIEFISWHSLITAVYYARGVFSLLLGGDNKAVDNTKMMEEQMAGGMQQQSVSQLFK